MRIRRQPAARLQLPPKVLQFLFWDTPFEVGAGVHSRRGVSLEINNIAVAGFRGRVKKMIERHFVKRSRRRKRRNVSADAFLNLVGADDHGHGVPAHQALDAPLHFLTAGEWRLGLRVDRILVGSRRRERKVHSRGTPRMQRQLLQQSPRPLRSALRKYIVERVQPLPRLQDFNTVRLLRLSHSDLTNENAIFHHKQLGRILLGCKQYNFSASIRRCASHQPWRAGSAITIGRLRNYANSCHNRFVQRKGWKRIW